MAEPVVTVIVVSYNTREKLRQCLTCIEKHHEIVVVDNASTDGSATMVAEEFSDVRLLRNTENRGFGAANNQGAGLATSPLVLYLNSDAYARPGAIDLLAAVFTSKDVAAAGGRLVNPDGTLQASTANRLTLWAVFCEQTLLEKVFTNSRLLSPYWNTEQIQDSKLHDVEQVMGACLMARNGTESFDERYFLYCEDTDLCLRLRNYGRIVYVRGAEFVHELGSSSSGTRWTAVARYNRGKELYFLIHHGRVAALACLILDRLGALARCIGWTIIGSVSPKRRRQADLFLRVLLAPLHGPTA